MKKIISTIVFATFAFITNAQGPQLAVQASPLLSIMSYDGESQNGIGFTAGLSCKISLGQQWAIRPEFNIQQRSFTQKYDESSSGPEYSYTSSYKVSNKLTYIDVPVLFEYKTNSKLGFYIGPQFGTDIGSKYTVDYTETMKDLETGEEFTEGGVESSSGSDLSFTEFSVALGTNYNLNNGLSFEFRLQRTAVIGYDNDYETDLSFTNIQLGCRYTIPSFK